MHLFLCMGDGDLEIISDMEVSDANHCLCSSQTHHSDTCANHGNTHLHPTLREEGKIETKHHLKMLIFHQFVATACRIS